MSAQLELIARMKKAEQRLEKLKSREQRRLITDYDWLRGWKDDFLGDAIADQYTQVVNGALSAITLMDGVHGGELMLLAGPAFGRYAQLWLGDQLSNYSNLDSDSGFLILAKFMVSHNTLITANFGTVLGGGGVGQITFGAHDVGAPANWKIRCADGIGITTVDSGILVDSGTHWHAGLVSPGQADYYLDGSHIATCTGNVPNFPLTAMLMCMSRTTAARVMYLDFWAAIPR